MAFWHRNRGPQRFVHSPGGCSWENARGHLGGLPAFLRVNATLRDHVPRPGFGHEIAVVIHFNSAGADGLPESEQDLSAVDEIEEGIKECLESSGTAVLAVVVTCDGVRRLYFYSSDAPAAIERRERELGPGMETHRVDFDIRPDPAWERYNEFASA